jgi:DNA-binding transcriptional regulator YiaG
MDGMELRERRKELRLQQVEIAEYLGVDNETVCRWERTGKELNKLQSAALVVLFGDEEKCGLIRGGRRARRRENG